MKKEFEKSVTAPAGNQGHGLDQSEFDKSAHIQFNDGSETTMKTGDIAIAAITLTLISSRSCYRFFEFFFHIT
jgi:aconitate hydratase